MKPIDRREFLARSSALLTSAALAGCATSRDSNAPIAPNFQRPLSTQPFARIDFSTADAATVRVGLRPYRDAGFVVRAERIGEKVIVHNYGHGGAGITLSWGCAALAADLLPDLAEKRAAIIGSGVIGLTTARELQKRGWQVSIHAKDLPPHTTSDVAGGQWAPTGAFGRSARSGAFGAQFDRAMATSFARFNAMSTVANSGVHWRENYVLNDVERSASDTFYLRDYPQYFPAIEYPRRDQHPFAAPHVMRYQVLMIEPAIFLPQLMAEIHAAGGDIRQRAFAEQAELHLLDEPVIINCTGLGARALFDDPELTPIRGQLLLLPPDPRVDYLTHGGGEGTLYMFPRADGIVLGGTFDRGLANLEADPETTRRLLAEHGRIAATMRL